ncbi:hypothetical protein FM107_10505 [Sphingobacterium sp. JB170]|nr:hypothetical protein FM107_10505 [Sphingobacterium sp. JB170]
MTKNRNNNKQLINNVLQLTFQIKIKNNRLRDLPVRIPKKAKWINISSLG